MSQDDRESRKAPRLRLDPPANRKVDPRGAKKKRQTKGKGEEAERPSRRRRFFIFALKTFLVLAFIGATAAVTILHYFSRDLPSVHAIHDYAPPQTTRVLDRNGNLIGEIYDERRTIVPLEKIPRVMVLSVLAAEDADFYVHAGFDVRGIARAVFKDALSGRATGASTITQQVVKLLLLSPERTIARKIRELILARHLEQELTKDEILHLYLNHINFGSGRNGVEEAARYYYGKGIEELTLAEASYIAGIPQSPARLDPYRNPEAAARRKAYVLGQLEAKRETHWPDLTIEEIEEAKSTTPELIGRVARDESAPEVMQKARDMLRALVGEEAMKKGGYTIRTTIDLELQKSAREAVQAGLHEHDLRQARTGALPMPKGKAAKEPLARVDRLNFGRTYLAEVVDHLKSPERILFDAGGHEIEISFRSTARYNPDELPIEEFAPIGSRMRVSLVERGDEDRRAQGRLERGPQAAAVILDVRTREIRALIGGYENSPGYDRATQAQRQPGSTFKAFVFAEGIRSRKITPASRILDAPLVYEKWRPQNAEPWFEGPISIRKALARSVNLVAVRLMEEVGPSSVIELSRALGIESPLEPNLALALGSNEVTPLELVGAYAGLAGGGRYEEPRLFLSVEGPHGETLELPAPKPGNDALTASEAYLVTSLLQSVVTDGTGRRARALNRPIAGKTGTSNDTKDAWFAGYSADTAAVVWVGFDDRRSLGRREGGSRTALPIFIDLIKAAEGNRPARDFIRPEGVEVVAIDPSSGLRAYPEMEGAIDELFLSGTAPTDFARRPELVDSNTLLMEEFDL